MKRIFGVFALAVGVAVIGSVAPVGANDAKIHAYLNGASERPGPGDPDAVGRAYITISDSTNTLCLTLQYAKVDGTLSGLHIHLAPPTSPGGVVVPFAVPTAHVTGSFRSCVVVASEALLDNIAAHPEQYYLNLHSSPNYGPGAIRGQLQGT